MSKFYAFRGTTPTQWAEVPPIGPCKTKKALLKAIKKDCLGYVNQAGEGQDPGLRVGNNQTDAFEQYHIMEVHDVIHPALHVAATVSLS